MSTPRSDQMASGFPTLSTSQQQGRSGSPSSNNSPVDSAAPQLRPHFGLTGGLSSSNVMAGTTRAGNGSPSHDMPSSSRLFSKRAREIQAQEGIPSLPLNSLNPLNPWGGPPTSGNSTPLRENIPESPTEGFPGFGGLPTPDTMSQPRRARAGTLPSRFSPGGVGGGLPPVPSLLSAQSARATPSQSPYNKSPSPNPDHPDNAPATASALLSRLRAGSMPQRSNYTAMPGSSSPFGPSIFSSWNPTGGGGRERGSTLASIASIGSNGPSSPAHSQFSKEGAPESEAHMRTLDYLGLAETPQPVGAQLATPYYDYSKQSSRFRSYSVTNKDKYADDEDDYDGIDVPVDSQYVAALHDQLAATQAAIHKHNLAVQAYANHASATRPRARTAGVLETPGSRLMKTYLAGNMTAPNSHAADMRLQEENAYDDLPQAVAGMGLGRSNSQNAGLLSAEEQGLDGPTSALWLGGVPTSTTTSTLLEMFKAHGTIVSARVLTHKNCGFVNFERVESAISAKASMNGKEIFPGAGPIRVNFAKPPSASGTPGHDGVFPSPSPDPFSKGQEPSVGPIGSGATDASVIASAASPTMAPLSDLEADMLEMVVQFGASGDDVGTISRSLKAAIDFTTFVDEIPPIREPSHTRVHDAPKLRDIRKRIDNQVLSQSDIEGIAVDMLPEIAQLSSDYLGNTVVQKLFEHCSDELRDAMLVEIAPHMAEIGVHKNGTWAAQKIIDVCKKPEQMMSIVEQIHAYTVPLFLDQYGNYVLQGCLKYGAPFNDFIFETMLGKMWDIAQGRYGARAMRACLESHHSTKEQQRMLAAAIALHSVQLSTNANGALLLTWLLDTCTFPNRRSVLAPLLIPHLVHLCTHKVAYLTVLKVINQKAEPEARDAILQALFFSPNDQVLEAILSDQSCGATLIFKVLTTPFFDESIRNQVVEAVKKVLVRIQAQPGQGYKRLMDEVGLSTRVNGSSRDASANPEQRQRPSSRHNNMNGQGPQGNKQFYSPMNQAPGGAGFEAGYGRPDGADMNAGGYQTFGQNMMYNGPAGPMPPMNNQPQVPYQQNMMNRNGGGTYSFPPLQPGFGGYNGQAPPGGDQFRQQGGGPIQPPNPNMGQMPPPGQPGYGAPGFPMGMGGYGYGQAPPAPQGMGYMQQEPAGNRRGRR